jgi:hypothetical protein
VVNCRKLGSALIPGPSLLGVLVVATSLLTTPGRSLAQGWPNYGHDAQHSCLTGSASQLPQKIRWSTPVDQNHAGGNQSLYIHYGTPVITRLNTVLVPVTNSSGGYQVEAHSAATGVNLWTATTDYTLPTHDWIPIFGITLTPKDKYVVYPGAGGTILERTFPDSPAVGSTRLAFYGIANYTANPTAFTNAIQICTPISSDASGNLYFGYVSSGVPLPGYPNGIPSGLARISSTGVGSFVPASGLGGIVSDTAVNKVAYNCAPAFNASGSTVYVAINNGSSGKGYLCALNATTLATQAAALLYDPSYAANTTLAFVDDDGSATPSVGPDGDVYYGVLGSGVTRNNYKGWLLHFDSTLTTQKLPSAFGWDDTASIVPASLVPSYSGSSSYLLLTKFNNYAGIGGDGINRLAVLDPNTSTTYTIPNSSPVVTVTVMTPVITVAGVTPDPDFVGNYPNAVREWCINSAAIDPVNKCAVVNSEDGHVYRWDFTTNSLVSALYLAPSTSEAYTPTVIGPDGAIYAINDATLYSCVLK